MLTVFIGMVSSSIIKKGFEIKPLFFEKHGSTVKLHLNKLQDLWNNVLWIDETTEFGQNAQHQIWKKPARAYEYKHPTLTARHGGGGVMIWARFAATGAGHLAVSSLYQSNLQSDVRSCSTASK